MSSITLNIGGLLFAIDGDSSMSTVMSLPGIAPFRRDGDTPTITLRTDSSFTLPECRCLHSFDIMDGTEQCRFLVDCEGVYYYAFSGGGMLRVDPRREGIAECTPMTSPEKTLFALWLTYNMIAASHGRIAIHSSTVVHEGRAVLCLGESGTGKSTHTRLWLENIPHCHLLNDDSPILSVEDGAVKIYGSPWSGKTPCYRQESYPVAAFLRLKQKPVNAIERLDVLKAFGSLQPSLPPAMAHESRTLDLLVNIISRAISATPVYMLGCRPDSEAAQLSFSTIFHGNRD